MGSELRPRAEPDRLKQVLLGKIGLDACARKSPTL